MIFSTSRRLWPLHWVLWVCAAVGVAALLVARGHYTVDILLLEIDAVDT